MSECIYESPRYYELAFSPDTEKEVSFYYQIFDKYNANGVGRVIELGAGSGRLAIALAEIDVSVVGVDENQTMLEYGNNRAKEKNLNCEIVQGDITDFYVGDAQFDNAFCAVETIRYIVERQKVIDHLYCVARALKPGGLYLIETYLVGTEGNYDGEAGRWTTSRDGVSITGTVATYQVDWENRIEPVRHMLEVIENGKKHYLTLTADMHAFDYGELKRVIGLCDQFELICFFGPEYNPQSIIEPDRETREVMVLLRKI